jgi:glycosyltransferase involved in cell wall biosynthesis
MNQKTSRRLAVFLPSLVGGGAERVTMNLVREAARRSVEVDLVLVQAVGPYLADVPDSVNIVDLGASRVLASIPALRRYLRRVRPEAMLTAISHANLAGIWAKRLAGVPTRLIVSEHDTLSLATQQAKSRRDRVIPYLVGKFYPGADGIIAVSAGVADDLATTTRIPRASIDVIYNPVITPDVVTASRAAADHPWLAPGEPPVVVGIGRLTKKKDFVTMLQAFAEVRRDRPARLIILGEGPERAELEALVHKLDLHADVALPGFVDNPYAFLSAASLFVLSSRWEGLPTVLIEAMFCGTPVVSTDCPSGPDEILQGGRYGTLVAVGDPAGMARAIIAALAGEVAPAPPESWHPYRLEVVTDHYLEMAFGDDAPQNQ